MSETIQIAASQIVFRNGDHNAFTSLCRQSNQLYLAFRNASDHLSFNGTIIVMHSENAGEFWRKYARISLPELDLRDPCLVSDGTRLLLYAGGRIRAGEQWLIRPSLFRDEGDGNFIRRPLTGLPEDVFFWKVVKYQNHFYGSGYRNLPPQQQAYLYESPDGECWRVLAGPFDGNELAFDIAPDGVLTGILRREKAPFYPQLLQFPVDDPSQLTLREISCPMQGIMVKYFNHRFLIAARHWDAPRNNLRLELFTLDANNIPLPLAVLPSGGDCSYAALTELSPQTGLLSYYSSHGYLFDMEKLADPEHMLPADIFTAKINCPV